MINWNKVSDRTKADLAKWYSQLNAPKPSLRDLLIMPFQFQTGTLVGFCIYKGYLPIVSTLGYRVRKYPLDKFPAEFVKEEIYPETVYEKSMAAAIQATLEYIDNPF